MRKALLVVILAGASAFAGTVSGSLSFSNTPLLRPEGESEPAVAVANDGTVAVTGLQWLFNRHSLLDRSVRLNADFPGTARLRFAATRQDSLWQWRCRLRHRIK